MQSISQFLRTLFGREHGCRDSVSAVPNLRGSSNTMSEVLREFHPASQLRLMTNQFPTAEKSSSAVPHEFARAGWCVATACCELTESRGKTMRVSSVVMRRAMMAFRRTEIDAWTLELRTWSSHSVILQPKPQLFSEPFKIDRLREASHASGLQDPFLL
jgi:hypothetical protein